MLGDINMLGFIPNLGFSELILILALALIVVGPGKLPEVGKAFGNSIKEFKQASKDIKNEILEEKEQA